MQSVLDDFKLYLPKYLSSSSETELFEALKSFPIVNTGKFYTSILKDHAVVFQGDGVNDLLVINLPNPEIRPSKCIVLSNTCDLDPENERNFPSQIVYAPIFNLAKYTQMIRQQSKKTDQQIDSHISSIKRQEITQIFYLPPVSGVLDESIVFLDRLNNCPNELLLRENLPTQRLFTLGDFGAYLFVYKLSLHFSRIQDRVERSTVAE